MVVSREPQEGTDEREPINFEERSKARRKKRAGAAVSIRKGKLLFLPTARPEVHEKPAPPAPKGEKVNNSGGN